VSTVEPSISTDNTPIEISGEESLRIIDEPMNDKNIQKLIDWMEQIWQSEPDLRDMIDPNVYERFIESLKEELDES
jgi:hypothetical protein